MSKLQVAQVDAETARGFWERQRDARIFVHPDVLGAMSHTVEWWLASWESHPVCLWPVCVADDGVYRAPELAAYVGPLWDDGVGQRKAHRWWTVTSRTLVGLLEHLVAHYGPLSFELPPGTRDVRVLQWTGPGTAAGFSASVEIRHTATVVAPDHGDAGAVAAQFSRDRIRHLRLLPPDRYREWPDASADELHALYAQLLERKQQGDIAQRRKAEFVALVDLARAGHGHVLAFRDEGGEAASFAVVLQSNHTAVAVVAASSSAAGADGLPATVRLLAMERSFLRGAAVFDFAGANSPIGAEDKHRYGAWPEMYFRVRAAPGDR